MEIKLVNRKDYVAYAESLVALYIDTFSAGKSFQYHNKEQTQKYLNSLFQSGYGIFAFEQKKLVGAILLTPLHFDTLLPKNISQNYNVNKSLYVAEMMVEKTQQGRGIGKKLLTAFFDTADTKIYTDAFIRVWIENEVAVNLYKKMGFTPCASIVQPKLLADRSQMFDFKKIYLHQELL